jgi:hypothetical protein
MCKFIILFSYIVSKNPPVLHILKTNVFASEKILHRGNPKNPNAKGTKDFLGKNPPKSP